MAELQRFQSVLARLLDAFLDDKRTRGYRYRERSTTFVSLIGSSSQRDSMSNRSPGRSSTSGCQKPHTDDRARTGTDR